MKVKLLSYCRKEDLFTPGERVICALSGGADSVMLLHCLSQLTAELDIILEAAHFNHMLRGAESEEDEVFVTDLCRSLGVPLHLGREDVGAYCFRHRLGTEEGARQCRYRFLRSFGCKIATAHNADDHLETVLMHLTRGSGLHGLCGISPKSENLVRPLLWATGEEIRRRLEQEGIVYRTDSSNSSLAYTRNRIRQGVLPLLRQENSAVAKSVLRQSGLLRAEDQFLDDLGRKLLQKDSDGAYLIPPLLSAPKVLLNRALRLMAGEYLEQDVSLVHIEALEKLLHSSCPSGQVSLPRGLQACRQYHKLFFCSKKPHGEPKGVFAEKHTGIYDGQTAGSRTKKPTEDHAEDATASPCRTVKVPLQIPGKTLLPGSPWRVLCEVEKNFTKMTNTPFHFALKYDMIGGSEFSLRFRQVGDRLQKADGHSRSVKKLMIDKKILRQDRDLLPVIAEGDQVLAVGGLGISSHFLPEEGQAALIITIIKS